VRATTELLDGVGPTRSLPLAVLLRPHPTAYRYTSLTSWPGRSPDFTKEQAQIPAGPEWFSVFQTEPRMLVCADHTGDLAALRNLVLPKLSVIIETRVNLMT
jgi:hypothetical protein